MAVFTSGEFLITSIRLSKVWMCLASTLLSAVFSASDSTIFALLIASSGSVVDVSNANGNTFLLRVPPNTILIVSSLAAFASLAFSSACIFSIKCRARSTCKSSLAASGLLAMLCNVCIVVSKRSESLPLYALLSLDVICS